jgi:hypothetical protein
MQRFFAELTAYAALMHRAVPCRERSPTLLATNKHYRLQQLGILKTDTRTIVTGAFARRNSSAAILFLPTSYSEAIQFYDCACLPPRGLMRLPLRRETDVASRHEQAIALRGRTMHEGLPSTVLVHELCEVLDAVALRLRALQAVGSGDYSYRHSDELRCLPIC